MVESGATSGTPPARKASEPTSLLWTGGSDSTYRLLDLVLNRDRAVQPYYLIDRKRSMDIEIRRMGKIKNAIASRSMAARRLIHPTKFVDLDDLPDDANRARQYQAVTRTRVLGRQYEYLARMADLLEVRGLELSVNGGLRLAFLEDYLERDAEGRFVLSQQTAPPELRLFDRFAFPIFGLEKLEMLRIAEEAGWQSIMDMTWFCLRPTPRGEPCGLCATCTQTIEEGMGFRLPARAWRRRRLACIVGPMRKARKAASKFVRGHGRALRRRLRGH